MSATEIRAWAIYIPSWSDKPQSVTMATTRAQAIHRNLCSAQGAGYTLKWTDFRARRAPQYDAAFAKHGRFSWSWDYVVRLLGA